MDLALFEISTLIANFFKIRAVYCFGYTIIDEQEEKKGYYSKKLPRYHFYLLVLNLEYKDNAVSLLQSLIREKFQGRYEVTILSHRANYLGKQSQNQKYFFDSIMRNGLLTYNNPLYPIYSKTFDVARDFEFSKNYWQNRILAAEHFLILVQDSNEPEVPLIINSILQESVKQIAVGLLDLFLGYHPNRHSIKHLFSLLLYLDIIELPFDLNNEKEKFLFQLLSANSNMIMHKDLKRESAQDSDILFDKCEKFFELAEEIGNKEIKRIESLNNDEPQRQEYVS
jgi:HEPN domain-containing protein